MGNNQGQGLKCGTSSPIFLGSRNGSKKSLHRKESGSGSDVEKPSQMLPIEKLSKILTEKSQKTNKVNGITLEIFTNNVFPRYPLLGEKLFNYFLNQDKSKNYLESSVFKQQSEHYLGIFSAGCWCKKRRCKY